MITSHEKIKEIKFWKIITKQGRKRPLDTPKRMIERRESEREGESERERERERERWKARRVNQTLRIMLSPNYGTRACKKGRGTRTVFSLRGKSSGIMSGNYPWIISGNYHWELWEREREDKGEQSKPNPSPNDFPKLWDASLREKSSRIMSGNYPWIISGNYQWELSVGIMTMIT